MIKSIRLIDWKSYEDSILYIDPLTILIGTNSSGKSNVVDALIFLSRISCGVGIYQAINGDVSVNSLRGGIDWVCRQGHDCFSLEVISEIDSIEYEYYIKIKIEPAKALIYEEKLVRRGKRSVRLFCTNLRDEGLLNIPTYFWTGNQGKGQNFELNRNTSVLFQSKSLQLKKKEIIGVVAGISELLGGIFVLDPIPNHMRQYSKLADGLEKDGSNIAGVLAALNEEKRIKVESILTSYLKKIPEKDIEKVWAECVGKFNTDAMLYCKEGWGSNEDCIVDAKGMSDGTLRFLAIITAMLTNDRTKLIVIEEVDNGLHPSRARNLLNMLIELGAQRNIDVVITTHNPALLDAAGTEMIPFITVAHRGSNGHSQLTLLEDVNDLPKLISMGNIGELATKGKIESALARKDDSK